MYRMPVVRQRREIAWHFPRSYLSVDAAVPDLATVIIRDTAIDAICRGAVLAGVGVIKCDEFKKDQTVAVLSQKKEFICLGRALVPSNSFKPGDTGSGYRTYGCFPATGNVPPRLDKIR